MHCGSCFWLEVVFASLFVCAVCEAYAIYKCGPDDDCWPSTSEWEGFNDTLCGKLIQNTPVAASCYPGSNYNAAACANVADELTNQSFVALNPIALSYPTESCPPDNLAGGACSIGDNPNVSCSSADKTGGTRSGTCSIGDQPRFTVNATEVSDVVKAVNFARRRNIRLVVRNTGHDILRRSTGYGSLEIWIRYLRTGITFQKNHKASHHCHKSTWTGSSFTIGGGYTWEDLYPEAKIRNLVVVGGGTPSVGCLGGWMQGGGHSPASHDFGLGADQVLEARVVLAHGKVVTASPCKNSGLFFALRGGGPSSYGIVVATVVKAHPESNVTVQIYGFAPLSTNHTSTFMEALAIVHQAYPDLSDAGFSGYGSWSLYSPKPLVSNYSTGFTHTLAIFGKTVAEAKAIFAPVAAQIRHLQSNKLFVEIDYQSFFSYSTYYNKLSGIVTPVGQTAALGSRLLNRHALSGNVTGLKSMLRTIAGTPEQATSNNIIFVGGVQVFRDREDPYSGVHPAWRETYVHNIVARGWAHGASQDAIHAVYDDVIHTKVRAMKDLAPDTGSYMNEVQFLSSTFSDQRPSGFTERCREIETILSIYKTSTEVT